MTKHEIEILNIMRSRDKSAADIAIALGLSVNTVRSYIRRHPPKDTVEVGCRQCGKPVMQHKGRKAKYFCSDRCRNAWWNAHPEKVQRKAYYTRTSAAACLSSAQRDWFAHRIWSLVCVCAPDTGNGRSAAGA